MIELDAESGAERGARRVQGLIWGVAYLDSGDLVVSSHSEASPMQWQWWLHQRRGPVTALTRRPAHARSASGVATQTTKQSSIALGEIAGGAISEVVPESAALSSFATIDTRGQLFYTARVPGG